MIFHGTGIHTTGTPYPPNVSGSNSSGNAPPCRMVPGQPLQPRVTEVEAARSMLDGVAKLGYDQLNRGSVLRYAIQIHNLENPADQIVLAEQDFFTVRFPKLHQWIDQKLSFLEPDQVFEFAFASSHLSEYSHAQERCRGNPDETRIEFFHRYFCQEGLDAGVKKLQLLKTTNIIYKCQESQLKEVSLDSQQCLEQLEQLEQIGVTEDSADLSHFNFPAALPIAKGVACEWKKFTRLLRVSDSKYVDTIDKKYPGDVSKAMLTVLHEFACRGGHTRQLVEKLQHPVLGRIDLALSLGEALQMS